MDPDPACSEKIRSELFDGVDKSKKIAVSPANAITNRLTKLLTYLDATYPTESWGSFLVAGVPDWSRMTLSGHSLGGGEAAYISKQKKITRAILVSAPVDGTDAVPAPWVSGKSATFPGAYFAFAHVADPSYARITAAWVALQVFGADKPVSADGPPAVFESQNALATAVPTVAGAEPHDAVILDAATPTVNGVALYTEAWARVIGPN